MGMFDELRCDVPLPGPGGPDTVFQTKDLGHAVAGPSMNRFRISADGALILDRLGWFGEVLAGQGEQVRHNGVVRFYTYSCDDRRLWIEYAVEVTNGICAEIELLSYNVVGNAGVRFPDVVRRYVSGPRPAFIRSRVAQPRQSFVRASDGYLF